MKDKKSLNKVLTAVEILSASIVFIYCLGVIAFASVHGGETFEGVNWSIAGPILFFAIAAVVVTIIKMAKVTVPALKNKADQALARGALAMDIFVLIGFVFLVLAMGGASMHLSIEEWETRGNTLISLILTGAPFMLVGGILSGKLIKGALK